VKQETTPTDMGSAADLKVGVQGVQKGICVWSERKKILYPSFPNVGGYKQANITTQAVFSDIINLAGVD